MPGFFDEIKEGSEYKFFSGGVWQKSKTGVTININSPIDGSLIGKIQAMNKEEIDGVVSSVCEAQKAWAKTTLDERAFILKKAAELLRENIEEIVDLKVLEIAKIRWSAMSSVKRSADIIDFVADQVEILSELKTYNSKDFPGAGDKKTAFLHREPVGVVLAISPFNYPVNLAVTKIAPALLAGNGVVVKGATQGSITTSMLVEVFNKAGVPKGLIGFVSGRGAEIGDHLIMHPMIDMINFTGSSDVGKSIALKAGYKPLLLELGGKDAALVLQDADLDLAAEEIVDGAFSYSGQRCTAIKRVLADSNIYEDLLEKIVLKANNKYALVSDPREENTQLGPVISEKQAIYLQELIDDAVEEGAEIVFGGKRKKNYIEATILDKVNENMRIAWEEQFGPVLPIIKCKGIEDMIRIHNASEYGLGGSVFSKDIVKAKEVASHLQTGVIQINKKSERYPDNFPFLGVKKSGLGVQGVRWSIESMTKYKSVVDNK